MFGLGAYLVQCCMQFISQSFSLLQFNSFRFYLCSQISQMGHIFEIHDVLEPFGFNLCHLCYHLFSLRNKSLYFGSQLCDLHPLLHFPLWLLLQIRSAWTALLCRRLRVHAFLRDMPLEDSIGVGLRWWLRPTLDKATTLVECTLLGDGENTVIAFRQSDLLHFLNIDFVQRVFKCDHSGLFIAEVEFALCVFTGLPKGRQWRLETFQSQVEILVILWQYKTDELSVFDDFCMRSPLPSIYGSQSKLSQRRGVKSFHFTFCMNKQIINYHLLAQGRNLLHSCMQYSSCSCRTHWITRSIYKESFLVRQGRALHLDRKQLSF